MATDWITTVEAVKLSSYNAEHIRRLIRSQKVKAQKWGREWQISKASLLAYKRQSDKLGEKRGPKVAGA